MDPGFSQLLAPVLLFRETDLSFGDSYCPGLANQLAGPVYFLRGCLINGWATFFLSVNIERIVHLAVQSCKLKSQLALQANYFIPFSSHLGVGGGRGRVN